MKNRGVSVSTNKLIPDAIQNIICVPSSWTKPQTYHVITEDGELDSAKYEGEFTAAQVYERFDIDVDNIETSLSTLVKRYPNDQDLGRAIRNLVINLTIL